MRLAGFFVAVTAVISSFSAFAQQQWLAPFSDLYEQELGQVIECKIQPSAMYRVCSPALRNAGNAPFVLHHGGPTEKTVVLFHGLSDSPFFFRSIAPAIHKQGYTVMVALLPGHGKKEADEDMEDSELANRWRTHVADVIKFARSHSKHVQIGGFSTGGTLATEYALQNPEHVEGLLLFSGALALTENVEKMARVWGIKWLAKFMDGEYVTHGPNPYKYASVAKHAAFMLTDVIFSVRELMDAGRGPDLPIFAAHSMADKTTPWRGVEALMAANKGENTEFLIAEEIDVCHADLVVNQADIAVMRYDESMLEGEEPCRIPQANPQHGFMLAALEAYLQHQ